MSRGSSNLHTSLCPTYNPKAVPSSTAIVSHGRRDEKSRNTSIPSSGRPPIPTRRLNFPRPTSAAIFQLGFRQDETMALIRGFPGLVRAVPTLFRERERERLSERTGVAPSSTQPANTIVPNTVLIRMLTTYSTVAVRHIYCPGPNERILSQSKSRPTSDLGGRPGALPINSRPEQYLYRKDGAAGSIKFAEREKRAVIRHSASVAIAIHSQRATGSAHFCLRLPFAGLHQCTKVQSEFCILHYGAVLPCIAS